MKYLYIGEPETIMLGERSQAQKVTYYMTPFT